MSKKSVTMMDVAQLAGVSQSAVSMILNNVPSSSFQQETVDRVLAAARQLNYNRKPIVKSPVGTAKVILVFAVKMCNPYYSVMLQCIEHEAAENGYQVLTCNTYHQPEYEAKYMKFAIQQNFAGIIFLYPPDNLAAFCTVASCIPAISICDRTSRLDSDIVELDNFRSGQLAAEHLVSLGHKHFAVFTYQPDGNTGRSARIDGIQNVLTKHGFAENLAVYKRNVDMNETIPDNSYDYHYGYSLANCPTLYEGNATAFICINDMLAFGVIDAVLANGKRIPDDISVMSFDNLLFTSFTPISLTTIDHHMDVVARSAVEILFQKIRMIPANAQADESIARFKIAYRPSLIVRKSTGPARNR